MKVTGYYMKPGTRCSTPGVVFSVAVRTKQIGDFNKNRYCEKVFDRAVVCLSKKTRNRWSVPQFAAFSEPIDMIHWIINNADTKKRNYILSPSASEVLTLTRWWHYAESKGILFASDKTRALYAGLHTDYHDCVDIRRCILRGRLDILDYSHCGKRFIHLSTSNYFDCDDRQLLGFSLPTVPRSMAYIIDSGGDDASLMHTAFIHGHAFRLLTNWWKENAKAPFGLTVGNLAMGVLRTHVQPKTISTHRDTEAHKLERFACYGGRASTWYVGNIGNGPIGAVDRTTKMGPHEVTSIPGPISHIDIRSMYPTLLRDRMYPCSFVKRIIGCNPTKLRELSGLYGTIARVTIYSDSGEYPLRIDNRLTFPRGYFTTTLAGPDLESIEGKDRIIHVHEVALYRLGTPFAKAAEFLLNARMEARKGKNLAWEYFCKNLANSMGGKLAQRKHKMVERREYCAERQWGEWITIDYDTGGYRRFRSISGMVFEICPDDNGEGPYTAAFAYLTAYGRQLMRRLRSAFAPYSVLSQDTDGLWILSSALESCGSLPLTFGENPGELRITESSANGRFFGPKHYYVDSGWKLSGFHNPEIAGSTDKIRQTLTVNPVTRGTREIPDRLVVKEQVTALRVDVASGEIYPTGWVSPRFYAEPNLPSSMS